MKAEKFTVKEFFERFPDNQACLDAIMASRMGNQDRMLCEHCGREARFYRVEGRRAYACQFCGDHFYPCVGTPFGDSRTSLLTWFYAMYLFTTTRHGVPAKELQRQLGVTYKTAWRMGHKLRELMADADVKGPLSGHVEIDETFVGGKFNARKGRGQKKKAVVMGIVERDGNMRAQPIPNVRAATLEKVVRENVMRGSIVSTDEWNGYRYLGVEGEYRHGTVNHGNQEWIRGIHHTNTIEGLWSRLKASIRGTHLSVSRKHLGKYVDEFVYRRNMRKAQKAMFDRLFETL